MDTEKQLPLSSACCAPAKTAPQPPASACCQSAKADPPPAPGVCCRPAGADSASPAAPGACCRPAAPGAAPGVAGQRAWTIRYFAALAAATALWVLVYAYIIPASQWITYSLLGLSSGSHLGASVEFFFYDTAKILLLLVAMVYAIAWIRASLHVERVRDYLVGKGKGVGYVLGSGFGAITPFCSCSSIPLFLGFTTAGIPVGITMAFLITSPIINEVAVVLLWGILGWKFTVIYVSVGMGAGILGGFFMDAVKAGRWLQPFLLNALAQNPQGAPANTTGSAGTISVRARHAFAWDETAMIVKKVWLWVIVGVALGAGLHGFVPDEWFARNLGAGEWWSVPLAVAAGIPLYSNVTGIIPVMESLLLKGLPIGTTLAFCMGTVAASLPEVLMLKQVMQWRMLALFLGYLLVTFTLVGWLFNAIGPYIM